MYICGNLVALKAVALRVTLPRMRSIFGLELALKRNWAKKGDGTASTSDANGRQRI